MVLVCSAFSCPSLCSKPISQLFVSVSSCTVLAEGLLSEVSVHLSMTACLADVFDSECWAMLAKPPR